MTLSLPAGHVPTGTELATITDAINPFSDTLTDYSSSFTITAATTNPTKGNSTYVAKYLTSGKMLWYSVKVTIGSTWSVGSGDYYFSVPATLDTSVSQIVPCIITDANTGFRVCQAKPVNSTNLFMFRPDQGSAVGSAGPGTSWASGDTIEFSGWLRLA